MSLQCDIIAQCDMERGSSHLLRNIRLARGEVIVIGRKSRQSYGGSELIWINSWHNGSPVDRYPEARARLAEKEAKAESQRVRRDPCPKCGTRGDLPCKHNKRAA